MGMFDWFARPKKPDDENVNTPQPSTANPSTFDYHFNTVGTKQPGLAYHSPLLQFQEYPRNAWQGGRGAGVGVKSFFRPMAPLTVIATATPITSGGSGIMTGQLYGAPLIDTGGGKPVV